MGKPAGITLMAARNGHPDKEVRKQAVQGLAKLGPEYAQALRDALNDKSDEVRREAEFALGDLRPVSDQTISALAAKLTAEGLCTSQTAAWALYKIGEPALPALLKAFESKDAGVRKKVLYALYWLKAPAPKVLAAFRQAMQSKDISVREEAVTAISYSPPDSAAADALIQTFQQDQSQSVRLAAVASLGDLAAANNRVVPALKTAMGSVDRELRDAALWALCRAKPPLADAVDLLAKAVRNKSLASAAMKELEEMGPVAAAAVPALLEVVNNPASEQRTNAVEVLGAIGPGAASAVPTLVKLLDGKEERHLRFAAMRALPKLGPRAKEAVPVLEKLLDSRDLPLISNVLEALDEINAEPTPSPPEDLKTVRQ
jgi:HEAT repeat protein